jgi:hypothetical protein
MTKSISYGSGKKLAENAEGGLLQIPLPTLHFFFWYSFPSHLFLPVLDVYTCRGSLINATCKKLRVTETCYECLSPTYRLQLHVLSYEVCLNCDPQGQRSAENVESIN